MISICFLETGKYVAIDLSGKNLRILLLSAEGHGREPQVTVNNYIVSNSIMKGTGEQVSYITTFIYSLYSLIV